MNKFAELKSLIKIEDVARYYGIVLKRGKGICPFHADTKPSLSISSSKQIYKCFVCDVAGDSIDLVSRMYGIKPVEAAKMISDDFRLGIEFKTNKVDRTYMLEVERKRKKLEEFKAWELSTFQLFAETYKELRKLESSNKIRILNIEEAERWALFFIEADEREKLRFYKINSRVVTRFERLFRRVRQYRDSLQHEQAQ